MTFLKDLFRFYMNSSVHVSLAVVALLYLTTIRLNITMPKNVIGFMFFSTITGYNFVKYAAIAQLHHRSLTTRLKTIQIFSAFSFLAMCYFLLQLNFSSWYIVGVSFVLTLFYAVPFQLKKYGTTLRTISGIKIFIIGLIWALTTVLLPVIETGVQLNGDNLVLFAQRFLWVVVITLPFEIRDLKYDKQELGTIPQRVGVYKTKVIGSVLIGGIFSLLLLRSSVDVQTIIFESIGVGLAGLFLWNANEQQSRYYASFWVEASPIFWVLIYSILY